MTGKRFYGKGYVGWINKRRVLVGNRALMQDYGVKVPSLEYEQHHTVNQRRVIYLAVSGKMFAMFQVAYQRDPIRRWCWKACAVPAFRWWWTVTISTAMYNCWKLPTVCPAAP